MDRGAPVQGDEAGVATLEMRPVVLVRQIRLCGLGVVIGVVVGLLSPWVGIAVVAISVALMATLMVRFRRS